MDVLERLIADHRRLRSLLALVERELSAYEQGGEADLQRMQDCVAFYSEYFNRFHHPLEDLLFERLLRRGLVQDEATADGFDEHAQLMRDTSLLWEVLEEVLQGSVRPRSELANRGHAFLRHNLEHMRHEEQQGFEQARRHLREEDWQAIREHANRLRADSDLERQRRQFDALFDSLREAAPA